MYEKGASGNWTLYLPEDLEGDFLSFTSKGNFLLLRLRGDERCVTAKSEGMFAVLYGGKNYKLQKLMVNPNTEINFYKRKGCKFWIDYIEGGEK